MVLGIANNKRTHWRYAIVAIKILRTLVRRDTAMTASLIRFFLERTYDNHPTIVRTYFLFDEYNLLTWYFPPALCEQLKLELGLGSLLMYLSNSMPSVP